MSLFDRIKKEASRHVEKEIPEAIIKILRGEYFSSIFRLYSLQIQVPVHIILCVKTQEKIASLLILKLMLCNCGWRLESSFYFISSYYYYYFISSYHHLSLLLFPVLFINIMMKQK